MTAVLMRDRRDPAYAHLVSPDPSRPGKWRSSRFIVGLGPAGHTDADTRDAALKDARAYGADPASARDVDPTTVDAALADLGLSGCSTPDVEGVPDRP